MIIQPRKSIFPIFVARRQNGFEMIRFSGTGFLIRPGLFVTCWHCVAETLPIEQGYLGMFQGPPNHPDYVEWLEDISQDTNGGDLATGRVRAEPDLTFQIAKADVVQGSDVTSFGYPFSGMKGERENRMPAVESRVFKGHIMRTFAFSHPGNPPGLAYELSFPAPRGLSGAPVIDLATSCVVGVIFGNNDVATIEHFAQVDDQGVRTSEVQRVVSFALAHHTQTLLNVTGSATGNRPLADVLERAN
jgi:hypothetical protein